MVGKYWPAVNPFLLVFKGGSLSYKYPNNNIKMQELTP